MERNVVCDVEMLKGRLSEIMGNTDTEYLYLNGSYSSEEVLELRKKRKRGYTSLI